MDFKIPPGANDILQRLNDAGYEAHLVGGCVRDLLRGATPQDWDICTSALPEQTKRCFMDLPVLETGIRHGTVTILEDGIPFEVTTYRIDQGYSDGRHPDAVQFVSTLSEDLLRRDFTINAIAMDKAGNLHTVCEGFQDLKDGVIRCVGNPDCRFQEDGLRVMRALRFASVLGYQIEEETGRAIRRNRAMLDEVAAERIQAEFKKLLLGRGVGSVLREYPEVFFQFWPDLRPLTELKQHHPCHCWNGWEHTIHAVEAAPPDLVLRLTMLLHDIGKPECKHTDEAGIDHFYGHEAVSAQLAGQMLRDLKFDNATRKRVVLLIARHDIAWTPDAAAIRRWFHRLSPEVFFQLLQVKQADILGQSEEGRAARLEELQAVRVCAEKLVAERQCFSRQELAVDGKDVIAFGIPSGPQVGHILHELVEKVIEGELPNERDILLKQISEQTALTPEQNHLQKNIKR